MRAENGVDAERNLRLKFLTTTDSVRGSYHRSASGCETWVPNQMLSGKPEM